MAVTVQLARTGQLLRPEPCRVAQQTRMEQLPLGQRPQPPERPTLTLLHRLRLLQHQQPRRQPSTRLPGYGHSRLAGCFNILPASFIFQMK